MTTVAGHLSSPLRSAVAVAFRPGLWPAAIRLAARSAASHWWRHWPPVPGPPAEYVAFRSETMFGAITPALVSPDEVIAYLRWCKLMRSLGG